MLNSSAGTDTINFKKSSTAGFGCDTDNNVLPPLQAEITCRADTILTKFTAVHELGHVFVGRTGGYTNGQNTFFGRVQTPIDLDVVDPNNSEDPMIGAIYDDTENQVVMGAFQDDLARPDWVRGTRGWGSWASPLPNPTNFQQNPLDVTDVDATQAERERERDEAAADMFLNWVYSTLAQGGFQDIKWKPAECHGPVGSIPSTCDDPDRPGFNRLTWMNTTMTDLLGLINP